MNKRYCGLGLLLLLCFVTITIRLLIGQDVLSRPTFISAYYETNMRPKPLNPLNTYSNVTQIPYKAIVNWTIPKITKKEKRKLKPILDLIRIASIKTSPKILCFVNTISSYHQTRAKAVIETWGKRCDKLLVLSNVTDPSIGSIRIEAPSDHAHLWEKHKKSIKYVYEKYGNDYDWFVKADDDSYYIMENLRAYVQRPLLQAEMTIKPIQLGRRFNYPEIFYQRQIINKKIGELFRRRFGQWIYNSGGAGYVMNRLYMKEMNLMMKEEDCFSKYLSDTIADDAGISFCMAFKNGFPWNTRDELGRERFHPFDPSTMYYTDTKNTKGWYYKFHLNIGGIQEKELAISPESISFHYIKPRKMYVMDTILYKDRE